MLLLEIFYKMSIVVKKIGNLVITLEFLSFCPYCKGDVVISCCGPPTCNTCLREVPYKEKLDRVSDIKKVSN